MPLPSYLIFALVACLFFGVGGAMQKHGIATALPKLTLSRFLRQPIFIIRTLITNWVWLLGICCNLFGGAFFVLALGAGQLSVVQPLVSTNVMISLLIGVTLFGERMNRSEWISLGLFLVGGAVLAGIAVSAGVATAPLLMMLKAGSRLRPEIGLAIAAGIYFGLGSVSIKAISLDLSEAFGTIDLLSPALWWAVLIAPHAWLIAVWNVLGFVCFQGAFSHGRVSIVAAVTNVMVMVAPVLIGTLLFHEAMTALRIMGIAAVALGTILLSLAGKEDPSEVDGREKE